MIKNDLTTTEEGYVLDARQGYELNNRNIYGRNNNRTGLNDGGQLFSEIGTYIITIGFYVTSSYKHDDYLRTTIYDYTTHSGTKCCRELIVSLKQNPFDVSTYYANGYISTIYKIDNPANIGLYIWDYNAIFKDVCYSIYWLKVR